VGICVRAFKILSAGSDFWEKEEKKNREASRTRERICQEFAGLEYPCGRQCIVIRENLDPGLLRRGDVSSSINNISVIRSQESFDLDNKIVSSLE
jgi:hypothetical protein